MKVTVSHCEVLLVSKVYPSVCVIGFNIFCQCSDFMMEGDPHAGNSKMKILI